MFQLINQQNQARRGRFETAHGIIETPTFMNVATAAAIKGGLSTLDLKEIRCPVMLCNTYHLHIRPGSDVIRSLGGLQAFTNWDGPILTDSGGFQIFSLADLRRISEDGVTFRSHVDGQRIFIGPEESMEIQSNLGSSIAMAFDECVHASADHRYMQESAERTLRWLRRCKDALFQLNLAEDTVNRGQLLFGINQGACFDDVRIDHMKRIAEEDLPGYAIGGLAVGETHAAMYHVIDVVEEHMPQNKPRYLMGVGSPQNIIEAVARGMDLFDCVMPTRNGRHGHFFTWNGIINIHNEKYKLDDRPLDEHCGCEVCTRYSRAYLRHLQRAKEVLALRFGAIHNLYFYNQLMQRIRDEIESGDFPSFRRKYANRLQIRV